VLTECSRARSTTSQQLPCHTCRTALRCATSRQSWAALCVQWHERRLVSHFMLHVWGSRSTGGNLTPLCEGRSQLLQPPVAGSRCVGIGAARQEGGTLQQPGARREGWKRGHTDTERREAIVPLSWGILIFHYTFSVC